MSYTALLVTDRGVVLYEEHARRLAPEGGVILEAYRAWALKAAPGVYAVRASGLHFDVVERGPSRLRDGMPVRLVVSPFVGKSGRFAKPTPPSPYDGVRVEGVCSLLTSADGSEVFESCTASVVAWDGARFVVPPADRPRVASLAEQVISDAFDPVERPILVAGSDPLIVVNAVKGPCVLGTDRPEFPAEMVDRLCREFDARTSR